MGVENMNVIPKGTMIQYKSHIYQVSEDMGDYVIASPTEMKYSGAFPTMVTNWNIREAIYKSELK